MTGWSQANSSPKLRVAAGSRVLNRPAVSPAELVTRRVAAGLTDIHHQGHSPIDDVQYGDQGEEEAASAWLVHYGVSGASTRCLRVHRGLLQHPPAALDPWVISVLHNTKRSTRTPTVGRPDQHNPTCPSNRIKPRSRGLTQGVAGASGSREVAQSRGITRD